MCIDQVVRMAKILNVFFEQFIHMFLSAITHTELPRGCCAGIEMPDEGLDLQPQI